MAGKIGVLDEALQSLSDVLGLSKKEIIADYRKEYGKEFMDTMVKDAQSITQEFPGYKEVPAGKALTTVVSGPAVPVGDAKVSSDFTKGKPIGTVSSPAASSRTDKALATTNGLTSAVSKGQLTLPPSQKALPAGDPIAELMAKQNQADPIVEAMANQQPQAKNVGEIKASGKHKGALIAAGTVAAGAGGAYMAGKGPNKESPQSPEMVAQAMEKQSFKNKALIDVNKKAGKAKTPKDWNQILAEEEKRIADSKKDELDPFAGKLSELSEQLKIAEAKYEKDKDRTAWSEVAEKLGFAFAQIGAGLHGLNTGVDVTGVKFNPTNWEARYDRSLAELKNSTGNIQKGIEQVQGEKKDQKSAEERKNEQAKGRLFDEYMSAKKITADAKQNQLRLAQELEIARMNNDQKTVKSLEKEKGQVEKEAENRLKTLMEIRADLQAASDDELDKPIREQAKKNFADNLRKLGKADLLEQIREKADDEKWGGDDFGAPAVLKLLDIEIDGVRSLIPNAATSPGQGPSGKVTFRFKPTGETKEVKSSAADKYRNDPNFEIISGE